MNRYDDVLGLLIDDSLPLAVCIRSSTLSLFPHISLPSLLSLFHPQAVFFSLSLSFIDICSTIISPLERVQSIHCYPSNQTNKRSTLWVFLIQFNKTINTFFLFIFLYHLTLKAHFYFLSLYCVTNGCLHKSKTLARNLISLFKHWIIKSLHSGEIWGFAGISTTLAFNIIFFSMIFS